MKISFIPINNKENWRNNLKYFSFENFLNIYTLDPLIACMILTPAAGVLQEITFVVARGECAIPFKS